MLWQSVQCDLRCMKKCLMCSTNGFEKKMRFKIFKIYVFLLFCTFCTNWFHVLIQPNLKPHFQKSFSWIVFLASKMSRNMHKLVWNLRNATVYPPWGRIFKKYMFLNVLLPYLKCETCFEGDIWKILRRQIPELKNQGPYKLQFWRKKISRCFSF